MSPQRDTAQSEYYPHPVLDGSVLKEGGCTACQKSTMGFGWVPGVDGGHGEHPYFSLDKANTHVRDKKILVYSPSKVVMLCVCVYVYIEMYIHIYTLTWTSKSCPFLYFTVFSHFRLDRWNRDGVISR